MKKMKRMMALLLAVIMTLAMGVSAFAADAKKGSLTVKVSGNNTLHNQTLSVYKLFDLTTAGENKYSYTVNEKYKDILKMVLKITDDSATDETFYNVVSQLNDDARATFAEDFTKAVLLKEGLSADATSGKLGDVTDYTFPNLDFGYYLVYQTGTQELQSSLVNVDEENDTTVTLKGQAPSIDKTADESSVQIGQVVEYKIKGTVPDTTGYENYVYKLHDTLSAGLDFVDDKDGTEVNNNQVKVTVTLDEGEDKGTAPKHANLDENNQRKMILDLSGWIRGNVENAGKTFTVTYYAKVNKDAVVDNTQNRASLEYGNNSGDTTTTTPVVVKTPTFPLFIKKTDINGNMLAGAKFQLQDEEGNPIKVKADGDGKYVVAENQEDTSAVDVMETIATEVSTGYNLTVNGLKAGKYQLVEKEAPDGYNKLTAPIKVTITKGDGTDWTISTEVNNETVNATDKIITVVNKTGTKLPETGGMGTMIFTVVALVLVLGVAVSFVISRRKTN